MRAALAKDDHARVFTFGHVVTHRATAYGIDYVRDLSTYKLHTKTMLNPRATTWR